MKITLPLYRHATIDMYIYTKSFTERKPLVHTDRMLMTNMYLLPLLDFDVSALTGKEIKSATLRMTCLNKLETLAVEVSTISQEWDPTTCTNYASCQDQPWANNGWFSDVIMSSGHSLYFREEVRRESENSAVININPAIIEAMINGQSYGFTVMDVKSIFYGAPEVMLDKAMHFAADPALGPVPTLEIEYEEATTAQPAPLNTLYTLPMSIEDEGSCAVQLSWDLPSDYSRRAHLELYFSETASDIEHMKRVPQFMTPHLNKRPRGTVVTGLKPNTTYHFAAMVRDDKLCCAPAYAKAKTLNLEVLPEFERIGSPEFPCSSDAFQSNTFSVGVTDDLVKTNPQTGEIYPFNGHAWNKGIFRDGKVFLPCARSEKLGFQLSVQLNGVDEKEFKISASGDLSEVLSFGKLWCLHMNDGWFPDAVVPIKTGVFSIPFAENKIDGQKQLPIFVDCLIPKTAPAGLHEIRICIASGDEEIIVPVVFDVAPVELETSAFWMDLNGYVFPPQMADDFYGEPGTKEIERAYYRMTYLHNGTINILPYTHNGKLREGYTPKIGMVDGKMRVTDWTEWDEHFASFFDGSYLEELIGERIPITHIQLPFHENWPMPIDEFYKVVVPDIDYPDNVSYHVQHCTTPYNDFLPQYREGIKSILKDFIYHFEEKGWKHVQFQYFFNNKNFYKEKNAHDRASKKSILLSWLRQNTVGNHGDATSWWLLDEPHFRIDYEILAFFGSILREAQAETGAGKQFKFRADLSCYNQMFDYFDGMLDTVYVGNTYYNHRSEILRRRLRLYNEEFWTYGTWNGIDRDNADCVRWFLDTFLRGGRGIIPWYNFARDVNYEQADTLAIVYPGKRFGLVEPVASMRLKAARKAIEFIRYLEAMKKTLGYTNNQLKAYINAFISVEGRLIKADFLDAGTAQFSGELNAIEALKADMHRRLSVACQMYL